MLRLSLPAETRIDAPNKPMASSNSCGVLVAVPSFISCAIKKAVPSLSLGSKACPPETVTLKLTTGNSVCSIPRTRIPLVDADSHTFGMLNAGKSVSGGSLRSCFVGVFSKLTNSFSTNFCSAFRFISSSTTFASVEPLNTKFWSLLGTKLVTIAGLLWIYFLNTRMTSVRETALMFSISCLIKSGEPAYSL